MLKIKPSNLISDLVLENKKALFEKDFGEKIS